MSDASLPPAIQACLRATIQSHPNVFKPGLGTIKAITAKLEMKVEAQPKFYEALPVLYALKEAVEAEYNRLESKSIVEKVEFSEWATPPWLTYQTPYKTTRSCGD